MFLSLLVTRAILHLHLHLHLLSSNMWDKTNKTTVEQDNKVQKIHS